MPQINSPTPDATTGTNGKLRLAGALGGSGTTAAAPKIAFGAATSTIVTAAETTTSTSYVDLTTTTDTVTATINASGQALVFLHVGQMYNNTGSTGYSYASFAVSGASTVAASDNNSVQVLATGSNVPQITGATTILLTGLTAGSTTFKMKYRVAAGTGGFALRRIAVLPL